jgi:hypothetical protein
MLLVLLLMTLLQLELSPFSFQEDSHAAEEDNRRDVMVIKSIPIFLPSILMKINAARYHSHSIQFSRRYC